LPPTAPSPTAAVAATRPGEMDAHPADVRFRVSWARVRPALRAAGRPEGTAEGDLGQGTGQNWARNCLPAHDHARQHVRPAHAASAPRPSRKLPCQARSFRSVPRHRCVGMPAATPPSASACLHPNLPCTAPAFPGGCRQTERPRASSPRPGRQEEGGDAWPVAFHVQ
jgi:hypothetical protein